MPACETVIDCEVAPLDQTLPEIADEVKTTLLPEHIVVAPFALIVGVTGNGVTITEVTVAVADVQPFAVTATL